MSKNATQKSSVNIWPSQEFRSTALDKKTIFIPTRLDQTEKGERHIILWEDVQQAFKGARCIMDGNVMVPFVTDKKFNRLLPMRIFYRRRTVLDVVVEEPVAKNIPEEMKPIMLKTPVSLPVHDLPPYPVSPVSSSKNPVPLVKTVSVDSKKSIQVGVSTCPTPPKPPAVQRNISSNTSQEQSNKDEKKSSSVSKVSNTTFLTSLGDDVLPMPDLETMPIFSTLVQEKDPRVIVASNIPADTPPVNGVNDPHRQARPAKEGMAIIQLMSFLNDPSKTNYAEGNIRRALSTLAHSDSVEAQRMAAAAFAKVTLESQRVVGPETMEPILFLLESKDSNTQCDALTALFCLTYEEDKNDNKDLVVKLGGLKPIIQIISANGSTADPKAQIYAAGCIANLASYAKNAPIIATPEVLAMLVTLAQVTEPKLQLHAANALCSLAKNPESLKALANANVIPVMIKLLDSPYPQVQSVYAKAVGFLALHDAYRDILAESGAKVVSALVGLLNSNNAIQRCEAALALNVKATNPVYQIAVVCNGGLAPLLRMIQSSQDAEVLASLRCLETISELPYNKTAILEAGILKHLMKLVDSPTYPVLRNRALFTTYSLVKGAEKQTLISLYNSGLVDKILANALTAPEFLHAGIMNIISVFADHDELRPKLLRNNILSTAIALLESPDYNVQLFCAWIISVLAIKSDTKTDPATPATKFRPFVETWDTLRIAFVRILRGTESTLQYLTLKTISRLLNAGNIELTKLILHSTTIGSAIAYLIGLSRKHPATLSSQTSTNELNADKGRVLDEALILHDLVKTMRTVISGPKVA
ncbi:Vacuolar protein 8 [Haplosporangium sp. Z 767]|nr:Vacuolar protein 8 [Haplosporangium sp. Z 11]KAF9186780.1 Vacuolar protein 8 [Haplosporangium sp. Z 767]